MSNTYQPARLFSIEQANAMLPLVRAIAADASLLAQEISDRRQRIAELRAGRAAVAGDLYSDELSQVEEELDRQTDRLSDYRQELHELGVEPKDAVAGLVDFPAMIDGRLVFLCWKLGEPEVLYWHALSAGYGGRKPLTAASGAGETGGSADLHGEI